MGHRIQVNEPYKLARKRRWPVVAGCVAVGRKALNDRCPDVPFALGPGEGDKSGGSEEGAAERLLVRVLVSPRRVEAALGGEARVGSECLQRAGLRESRVESPDSFTRETNRSGDASVRTRSRPGRDTRERVAIGGGLSAAEFGRGTGGEIGGG